MSTEDPCQVCGAPSAWLAEARALRDRVAELEARLRPDDDTWAAIHLTLSARGVDGVLDLLSAAYERNVELTARFAAEHGRAERYNATLVAISDTLEADGGVRAGTLDALPALVRWALREGRAEAYRLRGFLLVYGAHSPACAVWHEHSCDCGFEDALLNPGTAASPLAIASICGIPTVK